MGVVSWMVGSADSFLASAAESQFGAVAGNIGTITLLMVTLSLIGLCINMAFQYRSMDGATFFWYLLKLTLIGFFAFSISSDIFLSFSVRPTVASRRWIATSHLFIASTVRVKE